MVTTIYYCAMIYARQKSEINQREEATMAIFIAVALIARVANIPARASQPGQELLQL
ncbi:hypothetical protein [Bradyrhizobium stylosanthis]|uniref:hypothetical protein n=1 Tax=Bradyrhizobium stylosanthis TaxID=1803665 RepID=UPI001648BB22|nr:hypothetical protein [Bradyrhizobium stylosanthis]